VRSGKTKLKRLWDNDYKDDSLLSREKSPEQPGKRPSFLESILDARAPTSSQRVARASRTRDKLALYLEEPTVDYISVMEYWKFRETQ
jgi:hypothetical protein